MDDRILYCIYIYIYMCVCVCVCVWPILEELNYAILAAFSLKPHYSMTFQSSWDHFYLINVSDIMKFIRNNTFWLDIVTNHCLHSIQLIQMK